MSEWIVVIACSNLKIWKEVAEETGNVLLKESMLPVFIWL